MSGYIQSDPRSSAEGRSRARETERSDRTRRTEKRGYSAAEKPRRVSMESTEKILAKFTVSFSRSKGLEKGTHLENCTEERAKREAVKAY